MVNIEEALKDCLKTEVTSKDGEKIILFHSQKLDDDELKEFGKYTAKELGAILKGEFNFVEKEIIGL